MSDPFDTATVRDIDDIREQRKRISSTTPTGTMATLRDDSGHEVTGVKVAGGWVIAWPAPRRAMLLFDEQIATAHVLSPEEAGGVEIGPAPAVAV